MKKTLITTTLLATLFVSAPFAALATEGIAPAAPQTCEGFADTMTKKVVAIFHDETLNEDQKRQSLSTLFQQAVDTDWIGKFVLGKYWKTASAPEQAEYLKDYRNYLTMVYISKFDDESGKSVDAIKIAAIKPAAQPNQFDANTLIQRKGEPDVKVDYALEQSAAKCQVHDIKVEGISLLTSQRSEFGALASNSGVKGVIDSMVKKLTN